MYIPPSNPLCCPKALVQLRWQLPTTIIYTAPLVYEGGLKVDKHKAATLLILRPEAHLCLKVKRQEASGQTILQFELLLPLFWFDKFLSHFHNNCMHNHTN